MISALDHVVVLASDIEAGAASYQTLFGRAPSWRNRGDGAARVLFTLDNTTLELMAPDGESEAAGRIRAVLEAQGEGLASLCFRTDDIARLHRRPDRLALKPEAITEVESRDDVSGAVLSWKRTRTATEATRGVRMFFLELARPRPLSVRALPASIRRWTTSSSAPPIPNGRPRSMARGSDSTWRSTARTRNGAG